MKKKILFFSGVIAVGIFVALLNAHAPSSVHAGFLEDLWKNLGFPRGEEATPPPSGSVPQKSSKETPLYKPALDYEEAVVGAVKRASPAVVSITISKNVPIIENCPVDPFSDIPGFQEFFGNQFYFSAPCKKGSELREVGGGSGFIISSNGLVLTNKHVVNDAKASYTVFTNDGKKYDAKVLARDPVQDLAVLKIEAENLPTVALGDSDALQLGQTAIAIGNALGEYRNTVSAGVISGLSRDVTASGGGETEEIRGVIQTDAAINPGNSGGPLLNLRGDVVGVNTAVVSGAQNIGFAIPINRAKRDIESVKASGEIQLPFLGVRYIVVTPDIAKKQKLPVEYGALVRGTENGPAIEPGSPAEKAGIKAEDIILEVNGKRIDKDNALANIIADLKIGDAVALKIMRNGEELTLQATLGKRPQ